jgi:hypothetical protein
VKQVAYKFLLHISEPRGLHIDKPSPSDRVFPTREDAETAAKEAVDTLHRWFGPSVYMRDFKVTFEVIEASGGQAA